MKRQDSFDSFNQLLDGLVLSLEDANPFKTGELSLNSFSSVSYAEYGEEGNTSSNPLLDEFDISFPSYEELLDMSLPDFSEISVDKKKKEEEDESSMSFIFKMTAKDRTKTQENIPKVETKPETNSIPPPPLADPTPTPEEIPSIEDEIPPPPSDSDTIPPPPPNDSIPPPPPIGSIPPPPPSDVIPPPPPSDSIPPPPPSIGSIPPPPIPRGGETSQSIPPPIPPRSNIPPPAPPRTNQSGGTTSKSFEIPPPPGSHIFSQGSQIRAPPKSDIQQFEIPPPKTVEEEKQPKHHEAQDSRFDQIRNNILNLAEGVDIDVVQEDIYEVMAGATKTSEVLRLVFKIVRAVFSCPIKPISPKNFLELEKAIIISTKAMILAAGNPQLVVKSARVIAKAITKMVAYTKKAAEEEKRPEKRNLLLHCAQKLKYVTSSVAAAAKESQQRTYKSQQNLFRTLEYLYISTEELLMCIIHEELCEKASDISDSTSTIVKIAQGPEFEGSLNRDQYTNACHSFSVSICNLLYSFYNGHNFGYYSQQ